MVNLSLRERKYAKTKSDLMRAVVSRLASQSLPEVAVKEVCHDVQVSETTFFNYFAAKHEVLVYFVQLWSIDANWSMQKALEAGQSSLNAIHVMFDRTAYAEAQSPGVMAAIVAFQAQNREQLSFTPLTPAEYQLHFSDMPGIEQFKATGVENLLFDQLVAAQQNGELPAAIEVEALGLALLSIFFMTPILQEYKKEEELRKVYRKQLKQLFAL
ncbi:MAG: hypothetical protein AAFU54_26910 [Chloroflexota bacterium]